MNKEQFIALGLTDEQATKAAGASLEELKGFIPKVRFDEVNDAKKKLDDDIKDRDKQLEDLKKVDAKGLQAEIDRLQGENKTAKEKYEADMKDITLTNGVKLALNGLVHDEGIAAGLVDRTKLVLSDEGKIIGLDEQIKSMKESKSFLFKPETPGTPPPGFKIGDPPPINTPAVNTAISAAFGNVKK